MLHFAQPDIKYDRITGDEFRAHFGDAVDGFVFHTRGHLAMVHSCHDFVTASEVGHLAGYAKTQSLASHELYLAALEVREPFRGRRISHRLLESVFALATERNQDIVLSPYSKMGGQRLHPHVQRLQNRFPAVNVYHERHC